jgi:hypothetical protein
MKICSGVLELLHVGRRRDRYKVKLIGALFATDFTLTLMPKAFRKLKTTKCLLI